MRCDLISPFRVALNMPKHYIRAYSEEWQAAFSEAEEALLQEPALKTASLGNYGGARMNELRKQSRTLYGEKGISDPGYFFKQHHLLLLSGSLPSPDTNLPELAPGQFLTPSDCFWECRLYDSNLAVLILSFEVQSLDAVKACKADGREAYYRWTDNWVDDLLADLCNTHSGKIHKAVEWLRQRLLNPFLHKLPGRSRRRWVKNCVSYLASSNTREDEAQAGNDILGLSANPLYGQTYQRLWTHKAYSFAEDELPAYPKKVTQEVADSLSVFLSDEVVEDWRESTACYYGWGASLRPARKTLDLQWREAASVSQYYYTCLDIADTALPMEIARQRIKNLDGHSSQVLADTEQVSNRLRVLQNDYADIRSRAASEARRVLSAYHDNWRIDSLLEGIDKKIGLLRQLTETASDNLQKKNDDMMNIILFIIGVLGLVSLFTGLHDYLSGGMSTRFYDELPELALTLGKSDVMMGALLVILAALAAFFLYRRSR